MDQNFREASGSLCCDYRRSENSDATLTRSDSLTSFTVDLGPSLMTEVLGLIDSSRSLFSSSKDMEEEPNMCPVREEVRIEPQRFQEAADVLARHFGGGGDLVREERDRSSSFRHKRALYTFTETDEEIKV